MEILSVHLFKDIALTRRLASFLSDNYNTWEKQTEETQRNVSCSSGPKQKQESSRPSRTGKQKL